LGDPRWGPVWPKRGELVSVTVSILALKWAILSREENRSHGKTLGLCGMRAIGEWQSGGEIHKTCHLYWVVIKQHMECFQIVLKCGFSDLAKLSPMLTMLRRQLRINIKIKEAEHNAQRGVHGSGWRGTLPWDLRSGICTQYLQWRRGHFVAWSFVCQKFRKWCHRIGERCGVRMFGNSPRSGCAQNPFFKISSTFLHVNININWWTMFNVKKENILQLELQVISSHVMKCNAAKEIRKD